MKSVFNTNGYELIRVFDAKRVFSTCANCGQGIRYVAEFKHIETGNVAHIGETCLANSKSFKRDFDVLKKRAKVETKRESFLSENPQAQKLLAYLEANPYVEGTFGARGSLKSIADHLSSQGWLSNAQLAVIDELIAKDQNN